ncbi:MAG: protein kinase [Gemmataceae bacterium]|nr:protein kinase [Gemmataceae bacterium]
MPVPTTVEAFLELGFRSGLLEKTGVDAWCAQQNGDRPTSPDQLAHALIESGMLTHFQAEKLLSGRWRGFVIAGKYRLLERLGTGGMGSVYLCEHVLMGRRVALKVLPLAQAEDPAMLARFYREAKAVARLDHPNIVRAHDIDREDKLHFLVLEFVDGVNLHDFVRKNGVLSPARAADYIRQAALGLQHAHEAGLVHRDIKPGNLLLDRQGTIRLLDLGLARFFDDDGTAFAKTYEQGFSIGTADYMAPEQTMDHRVDIRADIYSLGGAFYYLLAGKSPFQHGSIPQKMIWHQVRYPKSMRLVRPDVPEGMVQVLEKMIAKDPARRPQAPVEVAEALAALLTEPVPPPTAAELPPTVFAGYQQPSSSHVAPQTAPRTPGTVTIIPKMKPAEPLLPGAPPSEAKSQPESQVNPS